MKIAIVSDDGETICAHFGRAAYYVVAEIENGEVVGKEMREKFGHQQVMADSPQSESHQKHGSSSEGHGTDPAAQQRHRIMAEAIQDCQVLIAGGMGSGAYTSMQNAGIEVFVTSLMNIDDAIQKYIHNNLSHQDDLMH